MVFFLLEPEVAGGLGNRTLADTSVHPPSVEYLHYEFDGWLGDELLESFPCFIVSEDLAAALLNEKFTGFDLLECLTTRSRQFEQLHPDLHLPLFKRLVPNGAPGRHDFARSADNRLVVSQKAKAILERFGLDNCASEQWPA